MSQNNQSDHDKADVENQIVELSKVVDYRIREYPIGVLVEKYLEGAEKEESEIFIPDYQRDFVWSTKDQSRFVESVFLGLPIPYLFVADVGAPGDRNEGRLEVIDGTQRLRTLAAFLKGDLILEDLKKLTKLNNLRYSDFSPSRQRRFARSTIRLIELTEHADEEVRRDMFDRLNSGGVRLNPMETRRGVRSGPFLKFIQELANDPRLHKLAPLSDAAKKRRDYEELVIRFFAYSSGYHEFSRSVIEFIDKYINETESRFDDVVKNAMQKQWNDVLTLVERKFPHGFAKPAHSRTPRVRFEAIAVGTAKALEQKPDLDPRQEDIAKWINSKDFSDLISSDGANSRPKVASRIEFVRDKLLGGK